MTNSVPVSALTVAGHGHRHVHVQLELGHEVRVRGEPELVAGEEEVVQLGVEHRHHQQEGQDGHCTFSCYLCSKKDQTHRIHQWQFAPHRSQVL